MGSNTLGSKHNALELQEPQDMYDEKQQTFTNYDERYKAKISAALNIGSTSKFAEQQIKKLLADNQQYKDLIASYKKDLTVLKDEIHNQNMNNIRDVQPMLKEFYQRLKDSLQSEKNENYKLQREMEQLNREKIQIQQQILFSHKRILELEKMVGIEHPHDIEDQDFSRAQDQQEEQSDV
eukprot:TRINITY_DN14484_c0_g1_i5.p1 TRINITY_DN14484_c0_g1~~TRINITY_DN14484_c0_g1_i5.p1  ORF type:complete len:180 (-),score=43.89 TRINITY_DN14484_c0_g1_i5:196-735(-)